MGRWLSDCQHFEAASRKSRTKFLDCLALEDEGITFSETSQTIHLPTQHQISAGLNPEPQRAEPTVCLQVSCTVLYCHLTVLCSYPPL